MVVAVSRGWRAIDFDGLNLTVACPNCNRTLTVGPPSHKVFASGPARRITATPDVYCRPCGQVFAILHSKPIRKGLASYPDNWDFHLPVTRRTAPSSITFAAATVADPSALPPLESLSTESLRRLAQDRGIPNAGILRRADLLTALSPPE